MSSMRTTLTLDPDVERLLNEEMHRVRRPYKQVVNDADSPRSRPPTVRCAEPSLSGRSAQRQAETRD